MTPDLPLKIKAPDREPLTRCSTDSLGIGLPDRLPAGTVIKLRKPFVDSFILPDQLDLHEDSEGGYVYASPGPRHEAYLPAELMVWGPEVMKPNGGEFHRAASEEMNRILGDDAQRQENALHKAVYRLHFVTPPNKE